MLILIPTFFAVALLYSTAGLGGGSAYIAAMVIAGVPKEIFPIVALSCNLLVTAIGFLRYKSAGHFRWKLFWPFALTSMPASYFGGALKISDGLFSGILAAVLAVGALRLIFWKKEFVRDKPVWAANLPVQLSSGLLLGFLAGITGIGGGIFLIPLLLLLGMATAKEASAVAALFIFVNSASGIFGQISKGGIVDLKTLLPLAAAVTAGGLIGSKLGATKLSGKTLQKIVGLVMLIAAAKLAGKFL